MLCQQDETWDCQAKGPGQHPGGTDVQPSQGDAATAKGEVSHRCINTA